MLCEIGSSDELEFTSAMETGPLINLEIQTKGLNEQK